MKNRTKYIHMDVEMDERLKLFSNDEITTSLVYATSAIKKVSFPRGLLESLGVYNFSISEPEIVFRLRWDGSEYYLDNSMRYTFVMYVSPVDSLLEKQSNALLSSEEVAYLEACKIVKTSTIDCPNPEYNIEKDFFYKQVLEHAWIHAGNAAQEILVSKIFNDEIKDEIFERTLKVIQSDFNKTHLMWQTMYQEVANLIAQNLPERFLEILDLQSIIIMPDLTHALHDDRLVNDKKFGWGFKCQLFAYYNGDNVPEIYEYSYLPGEASTEDIQSESDLYDYIHQGMSHRMVFDLFVWGIWECIVREEFASDIEMGDRLFTWS